MEYEIIATLGPASAGPVEWAALIAAGADGLRLNTSHLLLADLDRWMEGLETFFRQRGETMPLVLDLQGSKWRLGEFSPFTLQPGERVALVEGESLPLARAARALPIPHAEFFQAVDESGGEVVINDARIHLRVEPGSRTAEVMEGGQVEPRKGITVSGGAQRAGVLSRKDMAIIARVQDRARYAVSYVGGAAEMEQARRRCWEIVGRPLHLIAKLERGPAVEAAAQIAAHADALWLCRGDLGAEMGLAPMAAAARQFAAQVSGLPIPTLIAGQVIEHMTVSPTPTRSEVCYLYDCLQDGYHGLVLSDETAVGRYPVEAVRAAAMFRQPRAGAVGVY